MSILFAGFSSFPGAPRNPTEDLALSLQRDQDEAGALRAEVLPVAWEASWPRLRAAIEAVRPATVMLFGLHQRAERLRLELVARNRRELGRVDAVGGFPSGPAVLDGPQSLPANLPWNDVAAALRDAGASFEWSTDAGGYLCNDTFYRLAYHAASLGVRRFGFIHVPLSDEAVADTVASETLPEVFCSVPAATLERAARALATALHAGADTRQEA
ncbi:MAG TPA: hypothetical protein VIN77_06470 [Aurantimonas sp.]|uniref:Pyrrolidone-carboxylate peptidase n=1 Tax=Aurantimonas marianensis TaxID=2920428 RepID=A0A9X2HBG6_9HYPH|nr:hypothetical protein [Aurantimonas marianensis]MCP3055367.1 hypothetical protein [Aurantimonas marianensis]